jgi:CRP-like cAMP-binding protein
MSQPKPEELAGVPLFAGLTDQARAALAKRFEVRHFHPGDRMLTEGRSGYSFFVIQDGQASVEHDGQELRTLGAGDFCGEIAILGQGRRTATVTATGDVTAWELFGTAFRELEDDQPDVAASLEQAMRDRLAAG